MVMVISPTQARYIGHLSTLDLTRVSRMLPTPRQLQVQAPKVDATLPDTGDTSARVQVVAEAERDETPRARPARDVTAITSRPFRPCGG
jgi:hypothetical protein